MNSFNYLMKARDEWLLYLRSTDCTNKNEDYQRLVQQVQGMEVRLNITIQENVDLRATIDILHEAVDESPTPNDNDAKSTFLENYDTLEPNNRRPRNFQASSASANSYFTRRRVAFDAYRNKPFDETQTTITFDGTLGN